MAVRWEAEFLKHYPSDKRIMIEYLEIFRMGHFTIGGYVFYDDYHKDKPYVGLLYSGISDLFFADILEYYLESYEEPRVLYSILNCRDTYDGVIMDRRYYVTRKGAKKFIVKWMEKFKEKTNETT